MKKLVILSLLASTIIACRKNNNNGMVHGTITGYDYRKCACCGGYVLRLDNQDSSYRFFNFPANSYIDSAVFPQSVYLSYVLTDSCGPFHFIKVTAMMK